MGCGGVGVSSCWAGLGAELRPLVKADAPVLGNGKQKEEDLQKEPVSSWLTHGARDPDFNKVKGGTDI